MHGRQALYQHTPVPVVSYGSQLCLAFSLPANHLLTPWDLVITTACLCCLLAVLFVSVFSFVLYPTGGEQRPAGKEVCVNLEPQQSRLQ